MWSRLWKTPGHAVGAAAAAGGQSGGGDNDPLRPNTTSASSASAASALSLDLDLKSGRGHPDDDDPSRDKKRRRLMRKLYLHTVPIACLITCATFIDRANLALAAPVLLHDIGLTRSQFGFASAVMFVSYGCCMWLSALMFTVISLRIWFCVIVSAWGVVTGLMAVVGVAGMAPATSFAVLVFLRLALGAAEAGTMPGCFLLLSRFLPKRELAYAYSWVLIFTVLAQVIGALLGAAVIGPAEGLLGMRGWQWMFLVEGFATALLGLSIPFAISDSVEDSSWLSAEEKAWAAAALEAKGGETGSAGGREGTSTSTSTEAAAAAAAAATKNDALSSPSSTSPEQKEEPKQSVFAAAAEALQVVKSPQIWTLGIAILLVQTAFFAVTFFAPLLIADTFSKEAMALSSSAAAAATAKEGKPVAKAAREAPYLGAKAAAEAAMHAAFKTTSVYAPSALTLVLAGALCRATGDRKLQTFVLLLASAVGFAAVPVAVERSSSKGALLSLIFGSCCGVGSLATLTTWPDRYVTGRHRCAEYAFWNSFIAVGGFGGPYLMGAASLKTSMSIMAGFQAAAGVILLVFGYVEERGDRRQRLRQMQLAAAGGGGGGGGGEEVDDDDDEPSKARGAGSCVGRIV